MKTCTRCLAEKKPAEFTKHNMAKDGLRAYCKDCASAINAAYHEANRAKILDSQAAIRAARPERASAYRAANRERILACNAAYRAENPEKVAAIKAAYNAANPEKGAEHARNRRARKINADGSHAAADVRAIFNAQRGLCANCKVKLLKAGAKKYHVDHIMPLALGGSNWPANIQCLCPECNMRKGAKHPYDWAAQNGRLL